MINGGEKLTKSHQQKALYIFTKGKNLPAAISIPKCSSVKVMSIFCSVLQHINFSSFGIKSGKFFLKESCSMTESVFAMCLSLLV